MSTHNILDADIVKRIFEEGWTKDSMNPTVLRFTVDDMVEALATAINIFKNHGVNLQHLESRPSKIIQNSYDFFVLCECSSDSLKETINDLQNMSKFFQVFSRDAENNGNETPWFPTKMADLDTFVNRDLRYGSGLEAQDGSDSDYPGFTDPVYLKRRNEFADIAYNYKQPVLKSYSQKTRMGEWCVSGQPIPRVQYSEDEVKTWGTIFRQLTKLFPTHACEEYNRILALMAEHCGYREDNIPQLADVSRFLQDTTGFRLRPVAGMLPPREFLAGLSLRVIHACQYIRHGSSPMYTPEPDIVHDLLGHMPMYADPAFAKFAQEFGLASLGATDEEVEKLANLYWFTIEFGLCRQNDELKAYGAALLSSIGELKYSLSDQPEIRTFEPEEAAIQEYPITSFQPLYYVADSFEDARDKLQEYAKARHKPFTVKYDPDTQSIEVLDNNRNIEIRA